MRFVGVSSVSSHPSSHWILDQVADPDGQQTLLMWASRIDYVNAESCHKMGWFQGYGYTCEIYNRYQTYDGVEKVWLFCVSMLNFMGVGWISTQIIWAAFSKAWGWLFLWLGWWCSFFLLEMVVVVKTQESL